MADLDSGLTDSKLVGAVQKADAMFMTPRNFGAVGDGVVDDTVAVQALLDAIPTFTHGTTMYGAEIGGGKMYLDAGRYLITDTLYYAGGLTIESVGKASAFLFDPATPKTMFETDPTRPSRWNTSEPDDQDDYSWTYFKMSNISCISKLLVAPFVENNFINLERVHQWEFENCYFEGWYEAIGAAGGYYHTISSSVFFNNKIGLHSYSLPVVASAQPIAVLGGVFWNYEGDWDAYVDNGGTMPDELVLVENAGLTFQGTALEPRSCVNDHDTFVCCRIIGGGSVALTSIYTESDYPLANLDMAVAYNNNVNIDVTKSNFLVHLRLENFGSTAVETPPYNTSAKTTITGSLNNGEITDLIPNTNMQYGEYGYTLGQSQGVTTFDESVKFLGSKGVIKTAFTALTVNASSIFYNIPPEDLTPYVGQTVWVGMLARYENVTTKKLTIVQAGSMAKSTESALVDYGDGWGLYVMSVEIQNDTDELSIKNQTTAIYDDGIQSTIEVAGMFVWKQGAKYIPYYRNTGELKDSVIPAIGTFDVGDKVYNDTPTAGGSIGWVCTVAGSPGTWKSFGSIEA